MKYPDLHKMSIDDMAEELVKNQDLKFEIYNNMKMYGGSFAKALAECVLLADSYNLKIITREFTNYILEYAPEKWHQ